MTTTKTARKAMIRQGLRAHYQGCRVAYEVHADDDPDHHGNGCLRAANEEDWGGEYMSSFNAALNELAVGNRTAHVAVYLNPGEYGELDDVMRVGVGENEVRVHGNGAGNLGVIVTDEGLTWVEMVGGREEWILPANYEEVQG